MALVNGSPGSAALVADAALAARSRLRLAEEVLALSAEALRAPLEAYAPELEELWGDQHEAAALRRLRGLLTGGAEQRRAFQAPVSYRILPRVLGQAHRALAEAERAATVSLSEVSDNPIFVPPERGVSGGSGSLERQLPQCPGAGRARQSRRNLGGPLPTRRAPYAPPTRRS